MRSSASAQQVQADEELKRANAALEAQLEVSRGRLRQQTEEAEAAAKATEHALGALRHKLATATHQLRMREAEVKHARLAMLAAAGWPLAELWHGGLANLVGMPYGLEVTQGRSLSVLNGGLGTVAPFLALAFIAASVVECSTLDQVYGLTATGKTMTRRATTVDRRSDGADGDVTSVHAMGYLVWTSRM